MESKAKKPTRKELEYTIKQYEAIIGQCEKDLRKAKADLERANEYDKALHEELSMRVASEHYAWVAHDEEKANSQYTGKAFGAFSAIVALSVLTFAILTLTLSERAFLWAMLGIVGTYIVLGGSLLVACGVAERKKK